MMSFGVARRIKTNVLAHARRIVDTSGQSVNQVPIPAASAVSCYIRTRAHVDAIKQWPPPQQSRFTRNNRTISLRTEEQFKQSLPSCIALDNG